MTKDKKIQAILTQMRNNPAGVRFDDLVRVCGYYFGEPRQNATSHCVYKTPWQGNPRVNIQNKNGYGKAYQVREVLISIDKLQEIDTDTDTDTS